MQGFSCTCIGYKEYHGTVRYYNTVVMFNPVALSMALTINVYSSLCHVETLAETSSDFENMNYFKFIVKSKTLLIAYSEVKMFTLNSVSNFKSN